MDFQWLLLVRLQFSFNSDIGKNRWIWLEHGAESAGAWLALRRALAGSPGVQEGKSDNSMVFLSHAATNSPSAYLIEACQPQMKDLVVAPSPCAVASQVSDSTLR